MKKLSQKANIRKYLESGGKLTQMAALNFWGCMRLASRIGEINEDLWRECHNSPRRTRLKQVKSEKVKTSTGKYVSEYSIERVD